MSTTLELLKKKKAAAQAAEGGAAKEETKAADEKTEPKVTNGTVPKDKVDMDTSTAGEVEMPKNKADVYKLTNAATEALHAQLEAQIEGWADMKGGEKKKALIKAIFETPAVVDKPVDPVKKIETTVMQPKDESKAVKPAPLEGEVESNPLFATATQIEKMKNPEQIAKQIKKLQETEGLTDFHVGGLLNRFEEIGEFGTYAKFGDYVRAEFGMEYRKARYLMAIYKCLLKANVPYEKVKQIGWSKLKELVPVLNEQNASEWLEAAESLNLLTLAEKVKLAVTPSGAAGGPGEPEAQALVNRVFHLAPNQKQVVELALAKAKTASGTAADGQALEYVCAEYLGTASAVKPDLSALLAEELKTTGDAEVFLVEKIAPLLEKLIPGLSLSAELDEAKAAEAAKKGGPSA